jgi:hypothetical protein
MKHFELMTDYRQKLAGHLLRLFVVGESFVVEHVSLQLMDSFLLLGGSFGKVFVLLYHFLVLVALVVAATGASVLEPVA